MSFRSGLVKTLPRQELVYASAVAAFGLGLLIWSSLQPQPGFQWLPAVVVFLAVCFQVLFPLEVLRQELNLLHAIALGTGLLYGVVTSGWAVFAGILVGYFLRGLWTPDPTQPNVSAGSRLHSALLHSGMNNLALVLALTLSAAMPIASAGQTSSSLLQHLLPGLLFAVLHGGLYLISFLISQSSRVIAVRRDVITLGLIELLPLPFVFMVAAALPSIGEAAVIALAGIPAIISILMYGLGLARSGLERRVKEMSLLEHVSAILRSPLNLEHLYEVIQSQITSLTGVDNFYIALHDPAVDHVWYPLAVKNGVRQNWPPRALEDRLTDRVIREGKPLKYSAKSALTQKVDLPPSEVMPLSWLGVPLATADRTLGCLALFSANDEAAFQDADLDLLLIVSGQLGVAIENALLYDQAQRRLDQIESLNRLSNLVSASLDLEQVLQQICQSVIRVGEADFSAIYLLSDGEQVQLANAYQLSDRFIAANRSFSALHNDRTRCLRTGQPVLITRLQDSLLEPAHLETLQSEEIQAYGDFPLITLEGQTGILSVYYANQHIFSPEEQELLQTFAAQAAQAVANARLYTRTDTALSQRANQLSILEAVGRELAAATHSDQLAEMILKYAVQFTNSQWGTLGLYDVENERIEIKARQGYPESITFFKVTDGISGRSIRSRRLINLPDVQQDPGYIDLTGGRARSQLSIPLIFEERVLGALTLEHADPAAYSPGDQSFVSQLANQAAIAIANSQLYLETQRVMREQAMLYLVSSQLSSAMDIHHAVDTIERALFAALGEVRIGVYFWQAEGQQFELQQGLREPRPLGLPQILEIGAFAELAPALQSDSPIQIAPSDTVSSALRSPDAPADTLLLFPLVALGQRLGLVLVQQLQRNLIEADELQLLRAIIAQGAIALQNALLFSDVSHAHDRLDALLNSVREGILMVEASGKITLANNALYQLTGITETHLTGQRLNSVAPDTLRRFGYTPLEVTGLLQSFSNPQIPIQTATALQIDDASRSRVLERTTLPVWGRAGRLIGWMIVLRDITEENELAQARETITETLVHDLRSPLSAVTGALSVLEDALPGELADPYFNQAVQIARRSAGRMSNLVDSLLDISRMQSGRMELKKEILDLHSLVAATIVDFLPRASEYGILIRNDIPIELPKARGDLSKISRVLMNLLDNALKFTPSGGRIIFSANLQENGWLAVEIQDSGPGIPPEFADKIFERFSQVPGQRGRQRGSGLGLTFCKLAVEAHGGKIWYQPRNGGGSVFTFTLETARPPA